MDLQEIIDEIAPEKLIPLVCKLADEGMQVSEIDKFYLYHIESDLGQKNKPIEFLGYIQKYPNKDTYHLNLVCTDHEELKPYHEKIRTIFDSL